MPHTNVLVPAAVVLFYLLGMVWPTLRTWRRTGVWPLTLRSNPDPAHRVIGVAIALVMVATVAWAGLFVVAPERLDLWTIPAAIQYTGAAFMLAGLLVMLVAQAQMGGSWRVGIDPNPTGLVTGGLFGVVRNPVFTSMLVMMAGLALVTPSPWTVAGWCYAATLIAIQTRGEEVHLLRVHGAAYEAYAARVGRFVPGLGRLARAA